MNTLTLFLNSDIFSLCIYVYVVNTGLPMMPEAQTGQSATINKLLF